MSDTGTVIVHGGLEKAASTFLQKKIFPQVPGYNYHAGHFETLQALGLCHWSQLPEEVSAFIGGLAGTNSILSAEGLICLDRAYDGRMYQRSSLTLLNLIHLLGKNMRLVMVLRRQDSAIDSMIRYKQRYLADPKSFIVDYPAKRTTISTMWDYRSLTNRLLQSYNYYQHLVPAYELLGPDRVTLLLHEDLEARPEKFFAGLSEAFGVDVQALAELSKDRVNSRSEKYAALPDQYVPMPHILRRLNNLTGYRLEKFLPRRKSGLTDPMKREILDIFRDDNRRLSDLFDLNLDSHGYF